MAKYRVQRDINGNRVYYTDPSTGKTGHIKPDASYVIGDTRFNTNYVSNSRSASEMGREMAEFNHMVDADPNAVNTIIIDYDNQLATEPEKNKGDEGDNCK